MPFAERAEDPRGGDRDAEYLSWHAALEPTREESAKGAVESKAGPPGLEQERFI